MSKLAILFSSFMILSTSVMAQENADAPGEAESEETAANPDESADDLNASQQLRQTFRLERTIDGELVETKKKTITLAPGSPYRATEAGQSELQRIRAAFDKEALTRTEAFEEAKLDFTLADIDRNEELTSAEFVRLVAIWRQNETGDAGQGPGGARQSETSGEATGAPTNKTQSDHYAAQKFSFMSGAAETLSRQDYISGYLTDFDAMDVNRDTLLQGDELIRFRAVNRGETVKM